MVVIAYKIFLPEFFCVRPTRYANGNAKFKSCFSNVLLSKSSRNNSRTAAVGKKEKNALFIYLFSPNGCRRRNFFFLVANCQHGDRNQLVRRSTLDLDIKTQPTANPLGIWQGQRIFKTASKISGRSMV